MKIRTWHIVSISIIGILVLLIGLKAIDDSVNGIYDGNSSTEVLQHLDPYAWMIYSASPYYGMSYGPKAPDVTKHLYGFISTILPNGTMYVPFVLENSPAANAGLRAGDTINAIDGVLLTSDNAARLNHQINTEETTHLDIERADTSNTVSITKSDIKVSSAYIYVAGKTIDPRDFESNGKMLVFQTSDSVKAFAQKLSSIPTQFVINISPLAYLIIPLFWILVDGVFILLVSWIPAFFSRPRKWFLVSLGILLAIIVVPTILFLLLTPIMNMDAFKMFTEFGLHEQHGLFNISLTPADMPPALPWVIFLAIPNIILLIVCIAKGKDGSLMRVLFPRP